tara:strand:+ start:296 stop:607 length:312 start_codon:yes stop_codon:yes gene_type:complete
MPTYTFYNNHSGIEWDDMMSNSEREKFLKENPNVTQVPGMFSFVGDHIMGVGPKQDNGMKENLQRIAESHPGTPMADRYGSGGGGNTIKQQKTRAVLKKHGVI